MTDYPPEVWERQADPLGIVEAQGALVPLILDTVMPQVARSFTPDAVRAIPRIYLVGCGDSLYAGMAARLIFERLTHIPTEAVPALEFSRYLVDYVPAGSLVITISVSGGVSRSLEAAEWAKRRGCWVVGLTGRADSRLTQVAPTSIVHYAELGGDEQRLSTRGLANYQASLITLHLVAARIAVGLGLLREAEAEGLRQELRALAGVMDETVAATMQPTRAYAEEARDAQAFFLLGAGPNYATALFGAAKLLEGPNLNGVPQELEEWAHEQYFLTRQGTQVLIVAPPGKSADRALEIVRSARAVGARAVLLTAPSEGDLVAEADVLFPVAAGIDEMLTPLVYALPLELLAMHLQAIRGRLPVVDAAEEQKRQQVVRQSIRQSALRREE
ncbi:MAG TPA: SIS domain-containing protein [Chloroflexota bacterium]|nr:SIS domain-containing protein [Chloroflexota bacterium]